MGVGWYFKLVIHRYLRLTPLYLFVILTYWHVMRLVSTCQGRQKDREKEEEEAFLFQFCLVKSSKINPVFYRSPRDPSRVCYRVITRIAMIIGGIICCMSTISSHRGDHKRTTPSSNHATPSGTYSELITSKGFHGD